MNEHDNDITEEELGRVDRMLGALPPIEPGQALVRETLRRVEGRATPTRKARSTRLWAGGLAAASGLFAAATALFIGTRQAEMEPAMPSVAVAEKHAPEEPEHEEGEMAERKEGEEDYRGRDNNLPNSGEEMLMQEAAQGQVRNQGDKSATIETRALGYLGKDDQSLRPSEAALAGFDGKSADRLAGDPGSVSGVDVPHVEDSKQKVAREQAIAEVQAARNLLQSEDLSELDKEGGDRDGPADLAQGMTGGLIETRDGRFEVVTGNGVAVADPNVESLFWKAANGRSDDFEIEKKPAPDPMRLPQKDRLEAYKTDKVDTVPPDPQPRGPERASSTTNTTAASEKPAFIEARGYFANTYLPGDTELTALRAEVGAGLIREGQRVALDELAEPVRQPFDAPSDKALAVHLASEVSAVEAGPTRMTLQLGLKGALVAPTRRSAVNLALVVDVAGIADESERRSLWAVGEAMARELQPGDRLTVVASGTSRVLTTTSPAEVTRFLAEAYEARAQTRGPVEPAALEGAYAAVRAGMKADAPIGVDLVVLATTQALGDLETLKSRAHQQALGGIQTSVIGGGRADTSALRALAFSGQGRVGLVEVGDGVASARKAVQAELSAAGRVVARAVRLRVRLGAGVQLVSVVGSHRLDTHEADKVRAAEKAIDLTVAESTGIRADRGQDEDGIQIVIPAFMAGTDHVILFDVVVDGPGPVMDVRARFKDLVTLGNGEVSASLSLPSGQAVARAEQLQVVRNIAAQHVADALRTAAARLRADDLEGARQALNIGLAKVDERLGARPRDPALSADRRLLQAYERAVREHLSGGERVDIARVASSMRLAARLELGAR